MPIDDNSGRAVELVLAVKRVDPVALRLDVEQRVLVFNQRTPLATPEEAALDRILEELVVGQSLDIDDSRAPEQTSRLFDDHQCPLYVVLVRKDGRFSQTCRVVVSVACRAFSEDLRQHDTADTAPFVVAGVKDGVVNGSSA